MNANFNLLTTLAAAGGSEAVESPLTETSTLQSWIDVERALARAQARLGLIPQSAFVAIEATAKVEVLDRERLWRDARNVGYPILPLVRQLNEALPEQHRGTIHVGATTQDIMDSGLALELSRVGRLFATLLLPIGYAVEAWCTDHAETLIAARTHAQHAVPTTWGFKAAVYLADVTRHAKAFRCLASEVAVLSLHGAGGTSAGYGAKAGQLRGLVGDELDLRTTSVPWHVSRVTVVEFVQACARFCGTAARLAREVIDLSRNEIAEVSESSGFHRGASSTMPQKANPITSETIVGASIVVSSLAASAGRVLESEHERAAGEWHAEWYVVTETVALTHAVLQLMNELVQGLTIDTRAMRENLIARDDYAMAEAFMLKLSHDLGREDAHDVVYKAVRQAQERGVSLRSQLSSMNERIAERLAVITPETYLGDHHAAVAEAVEGWGEVARLLDEEQTR